MRFISVRQRFQPLTDSLGRKLNTDMNYLVSGGFWSAVGTGLSVLIGLATAVAFANLLSKETYGTYQYILSGVTLLGLLSLPAMKSAIFYAAARNKDGSFLEAIRVKMRWNLLSAGAAFAVAAYYFLNGNMLLAGSFAIVGLFIPVWEVYGNYVHYLLGKKHFKDGIIYEAIAQGVNAITIITILLLTKNLFILLFGFFASWTIMRVFLFRRTLHKYPPNTERDPELIGYAKHLSFMTVLTTLASNADKMLLWQFLGPIGIATYTLSLTVPSRVTNALGSINRLYFPKAVEHDLTTIRKVLVPRVVLLVFLASGIAIAYIAAAPYVFEIFFPKYMESVPYTQALSILIALQPISLFGTALSAHARKKELYIFSFIPPVLQIGLFILLIPTLHVWGAILSIAITQLVENILLTGLFFHASATPLRNLTGNNDTEVLTTNHTNEN
ncbi:MAG: O-antigen export protein [Parcubacteria bacterium C7867-007]|nr:MAG: O-antigen export protein [Parcubacteria bacterium C7867-007]